jgi:uncharacterized membrane protein
MSVSPRSRQDQDRRDILALEQRRQQAYLSRDFAALAPLFADELSYVHSNGRVENRAAYLANVVKVAQFLATERLAPVLRFLSDDVAALDGVLRSHTRRTDGSENVGAHYLHQIWQRRPQGWQQVHYQLSPLPAAEAR